MIRQLRLTKGVDSGRTLIERAPDRSEVTVEWWSMAAGEKWPRGYVKTSRTGVVITDDDSRYVEYQIVRWSRRRETLIVRKVRDEVRADA
jgi:hypothetical protein